MSPIPPVPHVRVLLATYQGERWLDEQLRTIFEQKDVRVSVVVSDHGSTDGTLALIEQWQGRGAALTLLPGAGPTVRTAAANFIRLLREADLGDAEFVALADQDDQWLPGKLARAVQRLSDTGASAYSCDALAFWPNGREARLRKSYPMRRLDYLLEPAGPGCSYVMTRSFAVRLRQELLDRPERFSDVSYHDWLIYAYARTHDEPWCLDDYVGLRYRQHDDNDVGANVGLAGIVRRWQRARSGLFRSQVRTMSALWPQTDPAVLARLLRLDWKDRCALLGKVRQLRRRPKDQLALFAMFVLGVIG